MNELASQVRTAIRLGYFEQAESMIHAVAGWDRDPVWLNLLGVIHEARGEWKPALRCVGKALRRDRQYAPAQQNIRRLYELYTFGHSDVKMALGDERPALALLLRWRRGHRAASGIQ